MPLAQKMIPLEPPEDCIIARIAPDGRGLYVYPLTFGRARLGIGTVGARFMDDGW